MRLYTVNSPATWGVDAFETFDRLFAPLGRANDGPAYDVAKQDDDHYKVALAVPGYAENELDITQEANELIVTGKARTEEEGAAYLRRGINTRGFESRFQLGDNVRVTGANLTNGVLHVELVREVPEALKPRRINIGNAPAIETQKAA